jgi:hypothetical protein
MPASAYDDVMTFLLAYLSIVFVFTVSLTENERASWLYSYLLLFLPRPPEFVCTTLNFTLKNILNNKNEREPPRLCLTSSAYLSARSCEGLKFVSSISSNSPISRARFSAFAVRIGIRLKGPGCCCCGVFTVGDFDL